MFRHGLRVSEACGLVLEQVDVESRVLHVARLKGGLSTTHPLRGDEIRAIKAWLVERSRLKAPGQTFFHIPTCCDMPAALPEFLRSCGGKVC
jgi:type 1 fimbriae regulatory protein FimB